RRPAGSGRRRRPLRRARRPTPVSPGPYGVERTSHGDTGPGGGKTHDNRRQRVQHGGGDVPVLDQQVTLDCEGRHRRPRPEHADAEERTHIASRSDALEEQGQNQAEEEGAGDVDGERRPREVSSGRRPRQPELVAAESTDEPAGGDGPYDIELLRP